MDSAQLEEYRQRMQARYQNRPPPPPVVQPVPIQPVPVANPLAPPSTHETEDERLARELQAQEDARVRYATSDEEYARSLQRDYDDGPE